MFDPTQHGFIQLRDFRPPGDIAVYEFRNHAVVDGTTDILRLNTYLTQDGSFVTLWWGLLEPMFAEAKFEALVEQNGFDFADMYNIELFRGHITNRVDAEVIFRTTGVLPPGRNIPPTPQVLNGVPDQIRVDALE